MYFENIPVFSELNLFSILLRIALALILGGALGIEREQKQHPAGFRTYAIVCLGATLACITNLYMCERLGGTDPAGFRHRLSAVSASSALERFLSRATIMSAV